MPAGLGAPRPAGQGSGPHALAACGQGGLAELNPCRSPAWAPGWPWEGDLATREGPGQLSPRWRGGTTGTRAGSAPGTRGSQPHDFPSS